eukprot:1376216-Rhodomonas_salina.1
MDIFKSKDSVSHRSGLALSLSLSHRPLSFSPLLGPSPLRFASPLFSLLFSSPLARHLLQTNSNPRRCCGAATACPELTRIPAYSVNVKGAKSWEEFEAAVNQLIEVSFVPLVPRLCHRCLPPLPSLPLLLPITAHLPKRSLPTCDIPPSYAITDIKLLHLAYRPLFGRSDSAWP